MKRFMWIGVAGMAGAIARVGLGHLIHSESGFPIATLTGNIVGTFLLCFIATGVLRKISTDKNLQAAVTTGFLGSFTTFSALSIETILLVENGQFGVAILYVCLSIIGGLAAGAFGFHLGEKKVRT